MVLRNFNEIVDLVKQFPVRKKCGVVAADEHAIEAALAAEQAGLADPIFIGNLEEIRQILQKKQRRPSPPQQSTGVVSEQHQGWSP